MIKFVKLFLLLSVVRFDLVDTTSFKLGRHICMVFSYS